MNTRQYGVNILVGHFKIMTDLFHLLVDINLCAQDNSTSDSVGHYFNYDIRDLVFTPLPKNVSHHSITTDKSHNKPE